MIFGGTYNEKIYIRICFSYKVDSMKKMLTHINFFPHSVAFYDFMQGIPHAGSGEYTSRGRAGGYPL